jgi:cytochrome c peroxidase
LRQSTEIYNCFMKPGCILLGCLLLNLSCTGSGEYIKTTPLSNFSAPFYFSLFELPSDNPLTNEGVELGRMLFYETKLSKDNSISCATCHQQSNAFTDGKIVAIGIRGQKLDRNTMSLVNMLWSTSHKFWDGRAANLEDQALQPIQNLKEMDLKISELLLKLNSDPVYKTKFKLAFNTNKIKKEHVAKALAQFQRTLISQDSKYDKFLKGELQLSEQEQRGLQSFFTHPDPSVGLRGSNCGDCHRNFLTDGFNDGLDGFANNGLEDDEHLENGLFAVTKNPLDKGKFKIPSLRNIALTAPYMHDGRFNTLEEVLDHYNDHIRMSSTLDILIRDASNEYREPNDPIALKLTKEDINDIIAFLKTLTDSTFITNEKYANPFIN